MTTWADQIVARTFPRLATATAISLTFHAAAIAAMLAYHTLALGRHPSVEDEITMVTLAEEILPETATRSEPPSPPKAPEIKPVIRSTTLSPRRAIADRPVSRAEIPISFAAVEQAALTPATSTTAGELAGSAGPRLSDRPAGYHLGSAETPAPSYPLSARRKGHQGTVLVSLDVGADGSAVGVRIAMSSGDDALDRAASETLARWRLVPAIRAGEPVPSRIEVPIAFVLE